MFKCALSSCSSTYPKQERIETNGDGVKPGYPLAGHRGANVQLGRIRPSLNIFSGSPPKVFSVGLSPVPVCFGVIRALMQHSRGGHGVSGDEDRVHVSRGMLLPLLPGTPQNCLRRFCGEPHKETSGSGMLYQTFIGLTLSFGCRTRKRLCREAELTEVSEHLRQRR